MNFDKYSINDYDDSTDSFILTTTGRMDYVKSVPVEDIPLNFIEKEYERHKKRLENGVPVKDLVENIERVVQEKRNL